MSRLEVWALRHDSHALEVEDIHYIEELDWQHALYWTEDMLFENDKATKVWEQLFSAPTKSNNGAKNESN